jgi:ribonuclease HI
MTWIPSNMGIDRNERVDKIVRCAVQNGDVLNIPPFPSDFNKLANRCWKNGSLDDV